MPPTLAPYAFTCFDAPPERVGAVPTGSDRRPPVLIDLGPSDAEIPPEPEVPPPADAGASPNGGSIAPATFAQSELEAAVRETEQRVRAEVERAAEARIERRLAEAVERLAEQLAACRELQAEAVSKRATAEASLVLAVARSIVPRALALAPLADLEPMLVELLHGLEREPRIALRLPPDLVEPGERLIREVAERTGWQGRIEVGGDGALSAGDARVVWADGQAERRLERVIADVEEMLSGMLAGQTPDPMPTGPEAGDVESEGEAR